MFQSLKEPKHHLNYRGSCKSSMKSKLAILSLIIASIFGYIAGLGHISYAEQSYTTERNPTQIISEIRFLINQTLEAYQNKNFSGASDLVDKAYLDNYELIEVPLKKQNETLMKETEIMLREELRGLVKNENSPADIQDLVEKINSNLNQANRLLSNQSGN